MRTNLVIRCCNLILAILSVGSVGSGSDNTELTGRWLHAYTYYSNGTVIRAENPPDILAFNDDGSGTFTLWKSQGSMVGKNANSHKFWWKGGLNSGSIIISRSVNKGNGILAKWTPVEEEYSIQINNLGVLTLERNNRTMQFQRE